MSVFRFKAVKDDLFLYENRKICDAQINLVIRLGQALDYCLLKQAVDVSLQRYPLLSCRFVAQPNRRPYWETQRDLSADSLCSMVEVPIEQQHDNAINEFLTLPLPINTQCGFQCRVIRGQCDTIVLKFSHIVCDGGGVKEYAYDLCSIYNALLAKETIDEDIRCDDRSLDAVYDQFTFKERLSIVGYSLRVLASRLLPPGNWTLPTKPGDTSSRTFVTRQTQLSASLKAYCAAHNVTVNDVVTAGFFRALHTVIQPSAATPLRIVCTSDLRRYLPEAPRVLCNLSSAIYVCIGKDIGRGMGATIKKVHSAIQWQKQRYLGLESHRLSALNITRLPYTLVVALHRLQGLLTHVVNAGKVLPVLTNTGLIASQKLRFGQADCDVAYITAPTAYYPVAFFCVTGCNNILTITAGFCPDVIAEDTMQSVLDIMVSQINCLENGERQ